MLPMGNRDQGRGPERQGEGPLGLGCRGAMGETWVHLLGGWMGGWGVRVTDVCVRACVCSTNKKGGE